MKQFIIIGFFLLPILATAQMSIHERIDKRAKDIEKEVIALRRHYHQYPELSNREFKTAEHIAKELKKLGLEVETGIAITGVVGLLDTGKPGPTIALRADIDGLPVTERVVLDFASKEKTTFLGEEVGVMHACGHDTHIAMLLGSAKILTEMKSELSGKIVFVFQPAEEGAPPGEEGGAKLMIKEGLIDKYGIDVFFGQHISSATPVGQITYKLGGIMAAANRFVIKVKGKQTHGSRPWGGVDPITAASQIIQGLNNIISRQTNLTKEAAVISIGKIKGGFRSNIIPEEVELIGTIRTLDDDMRVTIFEKIKQTATAIAASSGAVAEININEGYPVTFNNIELTRKMIPSLLNAAGEDNVHVIPAVTGAEDFSFFANEVPSIYFFTGGWNTNEESFPHHTPDFKLDERGMITGVKAMTYLAVDYMMKADESGK
ncbi:MAG: amidohydrolase [Saprospiraceae bacterium]